MAYFDTYDNFEKNKNALSIVTLTKYRKKRHPYLDFFKTWNLGKVCGQSYMNIGGKVHVSLENLERVAALKNVNLSKNHATLKHFRPLLYWDF